MLGENSSDSERLDPIWCKKCVDEKPEKCGILIYKFRNFGLKCPREIELEEKEIEEKDVEK